MANKRGKLNREGSLNISGNVTTKGGDVAVNITKRDVYQANKLNLSSVDKLFQPIYKNLDKPGNYSRQKREKLKQYVTEIEKEASKGKQKADKGFIETRLRNIAKMAPDILEITLGAIANPMIGLGMLAKKIANKASENTSIDQKKN